MPACPFAHFHVAGMRGETSGLLRQAHRDDHLTGFEHSLALRRIAGQAMKHLEWDLPPTCPAFDLDHGIERDEGDAEIGRMRSNAALAPAHYGVQPVVATAGVTA